MANVNILLQPESVFVDQSASSVTFSTSGSTAGTSLSSEEVVYQWYQKDVAGEDFEAISGETGTSLTLAPLAEYDNDTFRAGLSAAGAEEEVYTNAVTFGIRLSSDIYGPWETPTEVGSNRVRRLHNLGYL